MHYRFIILAIFCLNFWINPVFGNEEENPGSQWTLGDNIKYYGSLGYYSKATSSTGSSGGQAAASGAGGNGTPAEALGGQAAASGAGGNGTPAEASGGQAAASGAGGNGTPAEALGGQAAGSGAGEIGAPAEASGGQAATSNIEDKRIEETKPADANTEVKELAASSPEPKPAEAIPPNDLSSSPPPELTPADPNPNPDPLKSDPPSAISKKRKEDPGCEFIGAHAIADWLNSINIGSFFDYASRHILRNDQCYVMFDSCQSLTVWLEPYGFNAHYRSPTKSKKVDLTLTSIGTSLGARYALLDELHVGGGAGYFHSNFDAEGDKGTHINGFYFGPSVEYIFSEGAVGFMIMGIGNFYEGQRKISGPECKSLKYNDQSWDLDMRLEAEYDLHPPADFFIKDLTIHPYVRIDYLNVFEQGCHKESLDLKNKHSSFFYSKLSMRFEKVMFCNKTSFLTSNFDVGWVNMTPLSSDAFEWKANGKDKVVNLTTESKNQCALGFELVGGYHSGLLIGLGYQASLGASSPIQTGRARFEWNW